MKVIITQEYHETCIKAAEIILQTISEKQNAVLGLATGGTAIGVYEVLAREYRSGKVDFSEVSTINLDEYIGIDPTNPQSYRCYMDNLFFNKVNIKKENTYVPSGNCPEKEIEKFTEILLKKKLDLQLLGVGVNGHIGFNEPNEKLHADVHIVKLDEATIESNARFFKSKEEVPKTAITMGVGDILKAKEIVLVATGAKKANVISKLLLDDEVTTQIPCTLLKLHPNVTVVIDKALANMAGIR